MCGSMPTTAPDAPVRVAVGVILDANRNILLTRRDRASHQGGLWEFPGGKLEPGESLQAALARELQEELAITVERTSALLQVCHDYGDKQVRLEVHVVWQFSGTALPREGQPMVWVAPAELPSVTFPAANRPIVAAIQRLLSGVAAD